MKNRGFVKPLGGRPGGGGQEGIFNIKQTSGHKGTVESRGQAVSKLREGRGHSRKERGEKEKLRRVEKQNQSFQRENNLTNETGFIIAGHWGQEAQGRKKGARKCEGRGWRPPPKGRVESKRQSDS